MSRFSICGAMRRIFYLYIITHIDPRRPFLPTVPSRSSSFPSSVLLPFPRLSFSLRFSFSCSPLLLPFLPPVRRAYMYLFYFIIKQTSSCHPRATCVFTRIYGIHVKHSLHLTRGSAYATVPDTKNIFSLLSPSRSEYRSPFTCSERYLRALGALIATLKGIPS